jgi:DNA-binding MarR family transcriptional regulator
VAYLRARQLTEVVTRLRRVLRASIRDDYPWESLPMAQVELLQRLQDEPGLRISQLAGRQRLAVNTVSDLIQQLVVAGLVSRTGDTTDRRAVRLELTRTGQDRLRGWRQAHEQRLASALDALTADDRGAVLGALPALARLVDQLEQAQSATRQ